MNTELILGDCLDKMKDIDSGSIDLILTDPHMDRHRVNGIVLSISS